MGIRVVEGYALEVPVGHPRERQDGRKRNSRGEYPSGLAGDPQQDARDEDEWRTREYSDREHKVRERGHEYSLPQAMRVGRTSDFAALKAVELDIQEVLRRATTGPSRPLALPATRSSARRSETS